MPKFIILVNFSRLDWFNSTTVAKTGQIEKFLDSTSNGAPSVFIFKEKFK